MFPIFGYIQLIWLGVHIGHEFKNFHYFSSWFLFAIRGGIIFIDLYQTTMMLKYSIAAVNGVVSGFNPIWFINMDKPSDMYFFWAALACGEFYIASNWVYGIISNYQSIFNYILYQYQFSLISNKESKYVDTIQYWGLTRYTWPRGIFCSNVYDSLGPLREAVIAQIVNIGISDTNSTSFSSFIPIPANDDSSECLIFYNTFFSSYISSRKFFSVHSWLHSIRRVERNISFLQWINNYYVKTIKNRWVNLINYTPTLSNFFHKSISVAFSVNFWSVNLIKKFNTIDTHSSYYPDDHFFLIFLSEKDMICLLSYDIFATRYWAIRNYIKPQMTNLDYFNLNYLSNSRFPFYITSFFTYKKGITDWVGNFTRFVKFRFNKIFFKLLEKYFFFNYKFVRKHIKYIKGHFMDNIFFDKYSVDQKSVINTRHLDKTEKGSTFLPDFRGKRLIRKSFRVDVGSHDFFYKFRMLSIITYRIFFKTDLFGLRSKFFIHKMSFFKFVPTVIWAHQKHIFDFEVVPPIQYLDFFQLHRISFELFSFQYWSIFTERHSTIISSFIFPKLINRHVFNFEDGYNNFTKSDKEIAFLKDRMLRAQYKWYYRIRKVLEKNLKFCYYDFDVLNWWFESRFRGNKKDPKNRTKLELWRFKYAESHRVFLNIINEIFNEKKYDVYRTKRYWQIQRNPRTKRAEAKYLAYLEEKRLLAKKAAIFLDAQYKLHPDYIK